MVRISTGKRLCHTITTILVTGLLCVFLLPALGPAPAGSTALAQQYPTRVPRVYPDGTLVRGSASPRVYAVYHGVAHWITTRAALDLLGLGGNPILTLPQAAVNALPKGGNLAERTVANGLPYPLAPIATVRANIYLSTPSAPAGATLTVSGTGFAPGERVQIDIASGGLVAQTIADAKGTLAAGLTIPATRAPGVYRITATGLHSGFFAIEPFAIIPATARPSVMPSPSFASQGGTFTVSGSGFLPAEPLYFYDAHGAYAVAGTASAIGAFGPVTLQIPTATTLGTHSVWVYGARSRYFAVNTILVAPPGPATIQIAPPTASAGALETISGAGFVPGETIAILLNGQPIGRAQAGPTGAFSGLVITIPPTVHPGPAAIEAQGTTGNRTAIASLTIVALTPHLLVSPSRGRPGTPLTMAGTGFAPGETVTLSFNGVALPTTPAAITTDAQGNFFASATIPDGALSGPNAISATGTRSRATAEATVDVVLPVASTWYFAGLDTRGGTRSTIAVLNPDNTPARLTLHVAFPDAPARTTTASVGGHSRATLEGTALTGGRHTLAFLTITADRRIAAGQTTWRGNRDWSSVSGVSAPARTWYLAEGYTGSSFDEYIRVYNPHSAPAGVSIRLLPQHGHARAIHVTVPGDSGRELRVNRYIRGEVSAIIHGDSAVVVERLMVFGHDAFGATEGTGVTGVSSTWYFAEGATRNGFHTFYTILNPNPGNPAAVTATFYNTRGTPIGTHTIVIAPQHRGTIDANRYVRSSGMAAVLTSNIPVVAERALYFGDPRQGGVGGSAMFGRNGGAQTWLFPEGNTAGYREFLLLQNPQPHTALAGIEFYTEAGTAVHLDVTIPPRSRVTLPVNGVPGLPAGRHGALLASANGVPFIAEQTIFSGHRGDSAVGIAQ